MHKKLMSTLALGLFAFGVGVSRDSAATDPADCYVECAAEKTYCLASGDPPRACTAEFNACKRACLDLYPGPPPF